MPPPLANGRECGECTACCQQLAIDVPEIQKPAGLMCKHCIISGGCGIYQTRPNICRDWFCGWRRFGWLKNTWRPDKVGILVWTIDNPDSSEISGGTALVFVVIGNCDVLFRPDVVEVIGSCVGQKVPTFLSVPGVPGHPGTQTLLNPILSLAVERRDGDAVSRHLVEVFLQAALLH
jgi:hypothetical protein